MITSPLYDAHSVLGLHRNSANQRLIRLFRPDTTEVFLEVFGKIVSAFPTGNGFFEYRVPENTTLHDYRVYHRSGLLAHDPYAFWPTFGEMDQYLFGKGVHYQIYRHMGARLARCQDVDGVKFTVWAPNAVSISLVADFNHWDGRANPMRSLGASGIWELFVPGIKAGEKYKFEIFTPEGKRFLKIDPYALQSEVRPQTASVVAAIDSFAWSDHAWMHQRKTHRHASKPMTVYEVHLGSWRKTAENWFLNYREIAVELAQYCLEMGFTHVELMPLQEHPLDESWGYQVSGFYAVTSRFGSPTDFQWFVNHLHERGIGVILDWVPGHFPTDDFSLGKFDNTSLYEHSDHRQGFHPHWNTYIFNLGRNEVSNFLIANALFWFDLLHIDGLRVDAVASMLYLDYGREEGEWIPNHFGGKENLETIEFFKHLNSVVHENYSDVLMIAEESTSFPGVTSPIHYGGLGFNYKWNMGWMNDTLRYFSKDSIYRQYHQNDLTFGMVYIYSERFMLVLSHDEVVHGKQNLISKMPGDIWQKFANLRLLYTYMICHPGKKLLFMGCEFAQWNEWNCKVAIEWFLLDFQTHRETQSLVRDINHFYLHSTALWERDCTPEGFEWVDFSDRQNCVLAYLRKSSQQILLCVHNFTPSFHDGYLIQQKGVHAVREVFNSDATRYGGSGKENQNPQIVHDRDANPIAINIQLAPLSTMIFALDFTSEK